MSQEIVFTSARHGLRTGSTGFCTVRSTRGMPGNLAQLLERLTGYSHVFDAYGEQANLNPVNFAHYIARVGDQRFHILARVANAPLDHTNRSNKLAHLLALDSNDLEEELSEGPAAESIKISWVKEWKSETEPYVLADEKQIILPMNDQPGPGICKVWHEATGDAGWAAVLAATAEGANTSMQVILPRDAGSREETWALQLVHEALSLIPPAQRWDVSYSTFFAANLPVSVTCQWQFVLDGTDAAKRARLDPRARKIDIPTIAAEKRSAPENPLTKFTAVATRPWNSTQEAASIARRRQSKSATKLKRGAASEAATDAWTVEEEDSGNFMPSRSRVETPYPGIAGDFSARRSRPQRKPLLLRTASLIIGLIVVGAAIVFLVQQWPSQEKGKFDSIVEASDSKTQSQKEKNQEKKRREDERQRREVEEQRLKEADDEKQRQLAMAAVSPDKLPDSDSNMKVELPPATQDTPREPGLPPLEDIRIRKNRLEIKVPRSGLNSGSDGPIKLAKIHVTSLDDFELKRIIGGQSVLKPGLDFSLEPRDRKDEQFREWEVTRKSISGIGLGGNPDVVGSFRLDEQSNFTFRWDPKNQGFEIVNCLLEMEASESGVKPEREKCTLREVSRVKPVRFDPAKAEWLESLVSRKELANSERLELHCDFVNLPGQVTKTGRAVLSVGDSVKYPIQVAASGKYPPRAEIEVKLLESEQGVRIEIGLTLLEIPDHSRGSGQAELKIMPYTPNLMGSMNRDIKEVRDDLEKRLKMVKTAEREFNTLRKEATKLLQNKPDEKTQAAIQKGIDDKRDFVKNLDHQVKAREAELGELESLEKDLNKMLDDIAKNGELQFSLRLMIPDAGDGGVELVSTEEAKP